MDCSVAQELMSAYFDGELPSQEQEAVAKHLKNCSVCAAELAAFGNLSDMAADLSRLEPPPEVWEEVAGGLSAESEQVPVEPKTVGTWRNVSPRALAVAASILVVAASWFGYTHWSGHHHDAFTAEFGEYLDKFHQDPVEAQEYLLGTYDGKPTDPNDVIKLVGYRPAVADGVPPGYSVGPTYVMKMPCCTCVQCLCQREDGSTIVVFEHDDDEGHEWFGDRPESKKKCSGKQCSLVQLNDKVAATWKRNGRHITVVGIRDDDEISELVAWFDTQKSQDRKTPIQ